MCSVQSKVVDWDIRIPDMNTIIEYLYKSNETGGSIEIDPYDKTTYEVTALESGASQATEVPEAIINWHTHPIKCYVSERTSWGWPSGEDMRESLVYGLRGTACHVVTAVEGSYLIQINPCTLITLVDIERYVPYDMYPSLHQYSSYDNWGDFLRGFIIISIEQYCKSSHNFRGDENVKHLQHINPYDYIMWMNNFELDNMFNADKVVPKCGNISCIHVPIVKKDKTYNVEFIDFVREIGSETKTIDITSDGQFIPSEHLLLDVLTNGGLEILKTLKMKRDCNIQLGNIIFVDFYEHEVLFRNEWVKYVELSFDDRKSFLKQKHKKKDDIRLVPDTEITFKMLNLNHEECTHNSLRDYFLKYKQTAIPHYNERKRELLKRSKINIYSSHACSTCRDLKERLKNKEHWDNVEFIEYPTTREAIEHAGRRAGKRVSTVPAIFIDGEYVYGSDI